MNVTFNHECDNDDWQVRNFWIGQAKENEFFEVDIGQIVSLNKVSLKNSQNGKWKDM